MRIAIIQFPGTNCERETMLAVKRAGMEPVEFLWNASLESLKTMDGYILPGGFSYEDRSRAGIIAARDPLMNVLKAESATGKPVLGICNGAQILLEAGLVPGNGLPVALTENKRMSDGKILGTGYYNAWVQVKKGAQCQTNAFTRHLSDHTILRIPVAHAQGRFLADSETAAHLAPLIALQYCDESGSVIDQFPVNPNGSLQNIAALCNPAGNIMAIMPHPERTPIGDVLLASMRDYIACGYQPISTAPEKISSPTSLKTWTQTDSSYTMQVELIIADNEALAVQNTLQRAGIHATIRRQIHWEIQGCSKSVFHQIQASGVLYNEKKSFLSTTERNPQVRSLLVRAKEDWLGMQKQQQLKNHFAIKDVQAIHHGILWHIEAEAENLDAIVQQILQSAILFNPVSHVCYEYV